MSLAEILQIFLAVLSLPVVYGGARWAFSYWRKHRLPCHPAELTSARTTLQPCSFFIKETYQSDRLGRWDRLADIEVELVDVHVPSGTAVYLIPSGRAPRPLHNPEVLRNDRKALLIKRQASIRFAEKWKGQKLNGFWFLSAHGIPTVYSTIYDDFLKRSAGEYSH